MTTELTRLETIIARDLAVFLDKDCSICPNLIVDFKLALLEESEKIKSRIALTGSMSNKKAELKRYICHHQQHLIKLSTKLLRYTNPDKLTQEPSDNQVPALCHCMYRSIEDLLNFVERHFMEYFNPDAWVPSSYRLIAVNDIANNLDQLKPQLGNVDHDLVESVFIAFNQFIEHGNSEDYTYRQIRYLKTIKSELFKLSSASSAIETEAVRLLLIGINFNSAHYFRYCTNFIAAQLNDVTDRTLRLEKLTHALKEINQVRERTGLIYDVRYCPLKEQIVNWIAEELNFQQTSGQLQLEFDQADAVDPNVRIRFDASVAQVACLVRACRETRLIENRNLSELIRVLVRITETKKSENISVDSFRLRYYNIEDSTKYAVAKRLRELANYLLKDEK